MNDRVFGPPEIPLSHSHNITHWTGARAQHGESMTALYDVNISRFKIFTKNVIDGKRLYAGHII